jgi:hypothetical protein
VFTDRGATTCNPDDRFQSSPDIFADKFLIRPELAGIELAKCKSLYYRLLARGAVVSNHLHAEVSHVIVFSGAHVVEQNDHNKGLRDRLRLLRHLQTKSYEKRLVNDRWIEACIVSGRFVDLSVEYAVKLE